MIFKTRLARENWNSKYRYDNETPLQTFQRVARGIAEVEAQYGASPETVEKWYDKFLKTLVKFEEVGTDARGEDIYHSAIDGKTYRAVGLKATMGGRITANVGTSYDKATPWNCFSGRETFVTRRGVMSFEETCGQEVEVLTTEGWEKARIQAFGEQPLFRYVMKPARQQKRGGHVFWIPLGRSNVEKNVEATPDHRWILVNGQETTELREGDIVRGNVVTFPENELDLEHPEYREAFRHGLFFGDGYVNSRQKESTTFGIRLCGEKSRYEDLFDNKTYPPSYGGDPFCSVTTREKDYKKVPASGSTPLYIRGFIDGWASADGFVMSSGNVEISTQDEPALTWLRRHAALAGFFVVGYRTDSNKETNYGPRKAPLRRVILSRHEHAWKVIKKEDLGCTETVYCAVVPESRSFTLESGVYTGNCFIASPVSKAHIKYTKSVPNSIEEIITELETDESPDNLTNIFLSLLEAAETLRSEGGYGINFGFIRPRSSLIKGVGIRHPGVVSYMEIWDKMSEVIVKGDNDGYVDTLENFYEESPLGEKEKVMPRKGAMMAVLPIWHPDIEEFIRAKQEPGKLTKFNISVLVDDAFMKALESDGFYDLHFNGETYKRVKARDLYDLIMESTYNRSEPGILFFDNMNKNNPLLYLGPVSAVNPCVTGDTWVLTAEGPRQVFDLVGRQFTAIVNGEAAETTEDGFWKTGTKDVYEVKTSAGYVLKATGNHLLLRESPEGEEWVKVEDLEDGDKLKLSNHRGVEGWRGSGNYEEGWLLGYLVGEGTFRRDRGQACLDFWGTPKLETYAQEALEQSGLEIDSINRKGEERVRFNSKDLQELATLYGVTPDTKTVTPEIEKASFEFQRGFLRGLYDADGTVQGTQKNGVSVRLVQSKRETLEAVQRILSRMGIISTLYLNRRSAGKRLLPDGQGGLQEYYCKAQHELVISKENIIHFQNLVGFQHEERAKTLKTRIASYKRELNKETFLVEIQEIRYLGKEDVFDVSVPGYNEFDANGIRAHNCGEIPGSSFIDKGYKPAPYLAPYMLEQEEHHIGFTTVCLLGSINLPMFVRPDRTFDYDGYAETVATFARMLDNVNDLGHVPLPSYRWAVDQIRQYGMGVNGPGSAMYMMGLRYGSPEAASFMEEVHRIKDDVSLRVSALLAQEKGPFPMYTPEYVETPYFREFCKASEETKDLVRKYGVRNAKRLTNPPLGNSSVICDSVSNGIEPVFSHGYERTVIADEWPEGLNRDNVKTILKEEQAGDATVWRGEYQGRTWYYEPHNRGLCFVEKIEDYGYAWVQENYPEDIENKAPYLVTAQDLPAKEHVAMQAVVQRYCDQSVSKTCNVPNDYSFEDFKDLYLEAWRAGLIGFTTYRAGTMEAVLTAPGQEDDNGRTLLQSLIEQGCVAEDCELTEDGVIVRDVRLPETFVNGTTQTVRREGNKYYFHLSYLPNDDKNPIALWIHSNSYKEGEYVTLNRAFKAVENLLLTSGVDPELVAMQVAKNSNDPYHTKLGKIIAMALRHNISIPHVVQALSGIEGDYIATTLTAVRKFLTEQIPDGTEIKGATCQVCQSTRLIYESGCDRCLDCGSSECT